MVKGAEGARFAGFFSKASIENSAEDKSFKKAAASSAVLKVFPSLASKDCPFSVLKTAFRRKLTSVLKSYISRSRSTIKRTATDCTRPAESPGLIFFQSTGESS